MGTTHGYQNKLPVFFGRHLELDIIAELAAPRNDMRSAVVLIEGPGGIGKTMLMHMAVAEVRRRFRSVRCVGPLDMDDTDYRVASNTGMTIAHKLGEKHFAHYIEANRKYQIRETAKLDPDAVRFHMAMGDRFFATDYVAYARRHRVAIFIDTIEAILGTHIWAYFLRIMAALPNTLFVLAGRPQSQLLTSTESFGDEVGRFGRMELIGSDNVRHIPLAGWPKTEASEFVRGTEIGKSLSETDLTKLLHLSRCRPLHLTLALELPRPRRLAVLERMSDEDLSEVPLYRPECDDASETDLMSRPPDVGTDELSQHGKDLIKSFERELLLHFGGADPMAQTMRRLAHVRRRLNEQMYNEVLSFEPAIERAPTWRNLRSQPWIRRRADDYISLHDIVSELIQRYIWPLRDPKGSERRQLSRNCVGLYDRLLQDRQSVLDELESEYRQTLRKISEDLSATKQAADDEVREDVSTHLHQTLQTILETNRQKWVLEAERLYYLLDADLRRGYRDFLKRFDRASTDGQLIVREMILGEVEGFVDCFPSDSEERYQIGLRQIDAAIDENLLTKARDTLQQLRHHEQDVAKRYELLNRLGNIHLRTPGEAHEGIQCFQQAAGLATREPRLSAKKADALRELGWAYRQLGQWEEAAKKYRDALVSTDLRDRKPRAQILRNLAYVEALIGNYDEAQYFIDSSLAYRRQQDDPINLGADLSVLGEIHRYQRHFEEAHAAYDKAMALFGEVGASGWLGVVQQEKAICLIQESTEQSVLAEAEHFITSALYLCREFNPRNYPSALNRAGRVYVAVADNTRQGRRTPRDYSRAFEKYLEGIDAAQSVQDNWFEMANALEHAELALRLWEQTGSTDQRERIFAHQQIIEAKEAHESLGFPDLFGRWHLVKGHVEWREGSQAHKSNPEVAYRHWTNARDEYAVGFSLIAKGYFGSHGVRAVPRESDKLKRNVLKLPKRIALEWCESFEEQWGKDEGKSILLLGLVENIYSELDSK